MLANQKSRRSLSPTFLVAVLALVVSASGTAYALAITGADIVNGTVTTNDVKNHNLKGIDIKNRTIGPKDMAPAAIGARAVGTFYESGGNCVLIAARSRGVASCTRTAPGAYTFVLKPLVTLNGTYPICHQGGNGGYNTLYTHRCSPTLQSGNVRVILSRVVESTGAVELYDPVLSIPDVMVVP